MKRRTRTALRIAAVVALGVGLYVVGRATGAVELLTPSRLQPAVAEAGAWGIGLFLVAFVIGELVYVPGIVFVGVAVACWGPYLGGAYGYLGAVVSAAFSFAVVRSVGGQPLMEIEHPRLVKLLSNLERRPLVTVAVVRVLFVVSPPVNYGLALSGVPWRHHLAGTVVGLVVPIAVMTAALHLALGALLE